MSPRLRTVLAGLALVGVIAVAYFVAIRPARVAFLEHVATPLFERGEGVQSGRITLIPDGTVVLATGVGVDARDGEGEALFKTPLGDRPMLGVLALAFLYPGRRWWALLAATALAEGVITTICFAAGSAGVAGAFVAHRVAQAVLNDTIPLAMPALVFLLDQAGYLPAAPSASGAGGMETGDVAGGGGG